MDADDYVRAIACRCAVLVARHDRPARPWRFDCDLRYELRLLREDARRWGLTREAVNAAVLAELAAAHELDTAHHLHTVFGRAFWVIGTDRESPIA